MSRAALSELQEKDQEVSFGIAFMNWFEKFNIETKSCYHKIIDEDTYDGVLDAQSDHMFNEM